MDIFLALAFEKLEMVINKKPGGQMNVHRAYILGVNYLPR
jgi:hypothetical protein